MTWGFSRLYVPTVQYDAFGYLALAKGTPELVQAPFRSRVLTPWLAGQFSDAAFGFRLVNGAFTALAIVAMGGFLADKGFSPATVFVGQWFFMGGSGGIERLAYPYGVDAADLAFLVALVLLIEKRRLWPACALATLAAFNKETVVLLFPYWLLQHGRAAGGAWSRRNLLRAACAMVPAVVVLVGLRMGAGMPLDSGYFTAHTLNTVWSPWWQTPSRALYGALYYVVRSWGVAWIFVAWGLTTATGRRWLSDYKWLALPMLLPIAFITAPGRQYVLLFPILLPLACAGWRRVFSHQAALADSHRVYAVGILLLAWAPPLVSLLVASASLRYVIISGCYVAAALAAAAVRGVHAMPPRLVRD